jgi:hypothetical protein
METARRSKMNKKFFWTRGRSLCDKREYPLTPESFETSTSQYEKNANR